MIIDSHAHLGSDSLFFSIQEVRNRALISGVEAIVCICTDEQTLERGLSLKGGVPKIVLTAATTPHDVLEQGESFFPLVEVAASKGHLVAIGETGLDYHYEYSPKSVQRVFLLKYFDLATRMQLPIIFHCREAFEDLFQMATEAYPKGSALVHCFTGTLEEAKRVLDLGWHISLSGIVTFKKSTALQEVAQYVPLDRILVETDAPYLAPQSRRGQVNEPSFIQETVEKIAAIKNLSFEDVARATAANARAFFSL